MEKKKHEKTSIILGVGVLVVVCVFFCGFLVFFFFFFFLRCLWLFFCGVLLMCFAGVDFRRCFGDVTYYSCIVCV